MESKTLENYNRWLNSPLVSENDKAILRSMNQEEIDDAFYKDIEFGTAGMRGIIGPGTNRMNVFTIKKACIGYARFLLSKYTDARVRGVAISHDNRHIELSYAIRYKNCCGGIMITASHNPKEYNGFKVYDSYGCQLTPNKITPLLEIISKLPDELSVKVVGVTEKGINQIFGPNVDDTYVALVETVQLNPNLDKSNFKIVYTPNHGASFINAMRVFKDCGYNVTPVLSQCDPDPDFKGTLSPNPEDPRSYIEAIKLAKEIDADLICMTDPDGDRVGLACKNKKGEYVLLTGNESAAILLDYILSERKKKGFLSSNGVMYNTVVTSGIGKLIAENYGVKTESFLTGFKYIGDRIQYYEEHGGPHFEFGYEESYGCLIKPFVRDKDGIQAILLYCEMALFYKKLNITLDEAYSNLGRRFGYHKCKQFNIHFKGSSGNEKMKKIMEHLNDYPFLELLGNKVKIIENYFNLTRTDLDRNYVENITGLPVGDLIKFYFEDGTNISIRPSGTEPKCKFYIEVVGNNEEEVNALPEKYYEALIKNQDL